MQCFHAITLSNSQKVPCGQCINCRINKGRQWTGRLLLEHATTPPGKQNHFITLTIRPEDLKGTDSGHPTLTKKPFLTWLQNFKLRETNFRSFHIGEYGDESGRPHYHLAMFHVVPKTLRTFCEAWPKGFYSHSELNQTRAAYLCAYTTKKLTAPTDPRLHKDQEPEFRASTRTPPIGSGCIPLEVARYMSPHGQDVLRATGDICRTFRLAGKVYPFDNWTLDKIRQQVGIPRLHSERIRANENYLDYHETQEAEWDPLKYEMAQNHHAQKKKWKRSQTQRC